MSQVYVFASDVHSFGVYLTLPGCFVHVSPAQMPAASAMLVFGIMKLVIKQPRAWAFSLVDLLVLLAVLFLLAMLVTPLHTREKAKAQRIRCVSHLKQIGLSYRQWALDNKDQYPMQVAVTNGGVKEWIEAGYFESPFMVMSNELNTPKILWCPSAKSQQESPAFATLGQSNVNYFVGLDADETQPQMFLAGDDNLLLDGLPVTRGVMNLTSNSVVAYSTTRHDRQGNVGLSDGSVQCYSSMRFRDALRNTGTNVNRIAFP